MGLARTGPVGQDRETETTSRNDFQNPVKEKVVKVNKLIRVDTFKHTKNPR